ncbi:DUF3769 domain-containing protein [Dactylococcopsis salina]|uniref:Organic solvent tolerance protein OstA n=1 Tax=Dactylococcopsis salina (strain PCC 8305) TaxID=13035 RepID=K9YV95_DACS8|nr:DUF3769 domain-containing protein [Dactylococcopsis salina]AFZ50442.1 organic solvent tolerance protein OstA [Dactylococcopsis salina PCC 8305]
MLFADIPPPPSSQFIPDSNVSQIAFIQPLNTMNAGQKINQVRLKVRGGKTKTWTIVQRETETAPGILEITANRQTYDPETQIITASGNVNARFSQGILVADELKINVETRMAVGTGNVTFQRGEQVLKGDRFEYNFLQDEGLISNGFGEVYQPTLQRDTSLNQNLPPTPLPSESIEDVSQESQYQFSVGGGRDIENFSFPETGGELNRLRFSAEEIQFDGRNWIARNVRITNDPFSSPELEIRADTAKFRQVSPLVDEIVTSQQRLVFDDGFSVPIPRNRIVLDRRERSPRLVDFGFDSDDRGGLYLERGFTLLDQPQWNLSVTPQYFVQQALLDDSLADSAVFGLETRLTGNLTPRTNLSTNLEITGFEQDVLEDNLRGSIRLQQAIGRGKAEHNLNLEASFRDRLFNGSLGFQTVQSSVGAVITSPTFPLGDTGINFSYQGGIQRINAETDVAALLEPNRENDRINLTRYQVATDFNWGTSLWTGDTLPATKEEGLRYTPSPVRPNLRLTTRVRGVTTLYSSGDDQNSISLTVGLSGQLGNFSEKTFDYTSFNASYTQVIGEGESPFEFDRIADRKRLSLGVMQQVYGPFLAGVQTSLNLDDGEVISSNIILEYSRRTYNLRLRFNPTQEIGSVSIQINGFNWKGSPNAFDDFQSVEDGVIQ